jgi:hypothetical protein
MQAIWQPQQVIWWNKPMFQSQAESFGILVVLWSLEPFLCLEQILFLEAEESRPTWLGLCVWRI